jgi:uncharacterized protein (DUF39 family)
VVPTLSERDLRPLISNRTLGGSGFFEPLSWAALVAVVVRNRRAFLGGSAAIVVGVVGADVMGRHGPSVAAP